MDQTVEVAIALAALDASPDGFAAVDEGGRLVAFNQAAEHLLGWSRDELLGGPDRSVPDDRRARVAALLGRMRDAGGTTPRLAVRTTRDGSQILLAVTRYVRIPDGAGGTVIGAFFRSADADEIREHHRNELSRALVEATRTDEILRAAQRHLEEVVGAHTALVLTACRDGHLHGSHVVGGNREDAEQVELVRSEDAPWAHALESGAAIGRLDVDPWRDAPTLFVPMGPPKDRGLLALVFDDEVPSDPTLHAVAGALADELWLALQRAHLVAELEGKVEILEATAAVASSVGLELEDTLAVVTRHAAEALSCERAGIYLRRPDGTLEIGALYATDVDVTDPDGFELANEVLQRSDRILVQDASDCPFLDGPWHRDRGAVSVFALPLEVAGRDIGVLAVAHTESNPRGFTNLCQQVGVAVAQQAAIAIEHARLFAVERDTVAQLRRLDQLKADYVAGLTHDLRTPLTGLVGFVRTLRRLGDAVDEQRRGEYLEVMERQAWRLAAMVEDMLTAARLEDGVLRPSTVRRVELAALVADALEAFEPGRRTRVRLVDAPLDVAASGDPDQLLRVVRNLIDNALKYSPRSEPVEVGVRQVGDTVEVTVRDHGPGLDEEQVVAAFERFRTADGEPTSSSGLGLYISRGIAQGHGGDVVYDAAPGGGSIFRLCLPAATD